jgi:DNA repair exonuclease SbcCD ATPase subunit
MAKKIKANDLFEKEDIFQGIRESITQTLAKVREFDSELKSTAVTLEKTVKSATFDTTKGINDFVAATEKAEQAQKESIAVKKAMIDLEKQQVLLDKELQKLEIEKEKVAQQQLRTSQAQAKADQKKAMESAKAAKTAKDQASAYKQLEKSTRELKNQSKELAAQMLIMEKAGRQNTNAYKQLEQQYREVSLAARDGDQALKGIDKTVGDNFRNVGNYEGAVGSLKTELRKLTNELARMESTDPRFAEMAARAGELKDTIQDTQAVIKGTAGSAVENLAGAFGKVGQIGIGAFQGVESSMALFGVQSEAVMQTMVRLQALAGLTDAFEMLGGLGDKITEIRAAVTAAIPKIAEFIGLKQADVVVTTAETVATETATVATSGLGKAMKALPIFLIIGGIAALVAAFVDWNGETSKQEKESKKLADQQKNLAKYTREAAQNVSTESGELVGLVYQLKATNENSKERSDLMKQINDKYGLTLKNLSDENEFQEQLNGTVREYIELQYNRFKLDKNQKFTNNLLEQRFLLETNLAKRRKEIADLESKRAKISERTDLNENQRRVQLSVIESKIQRLKESRSETDYLKEGDSLVVLNEKLAENEKNLEKIGLRRNQLTQVENQITGNGKRYVEQEDKKTESTKKNTEAVDKNYESYAEYYKLLEDTELYQVQKQINDEMANQLKNAELNGITSMETLDQLIQKEYELKLAILERKKEASIETNGPEFAEKEFTLEKMKLDDEYTATRKSNMNDLMNAEKEYADKFETNQDKINEKIQNQQEIVKATSDYFMKRSNEKIAQLDKEISAAENQYSVLQELAKNGNINAQQSLAEQQRIINEANLKKERELKRQERIKLAESVWSTYSNKLADEKVKNPLAETIRDTVLLSQFINSLPAFEKGTEDTGSNGRGVDGKGGFHAILHPNERVVPKTLNEKIGSMTNEQLATMAQEYQNGKIIRDGMQIASAMDTLLIANKIDELNATIRNKPETNIEMGEITSSIMEVVKSTKVGNTVTYNKFKVKR